MRDDALPLRRVVFVGASIACAVAVAIGTAVAILAHRTLPLGGVAVARPAPLGDDLPMLQTAPQQDLATYKREKADALNGLGWVDAASGVAHVPIDVAMTMLVARTTMAATAASAAASSTGATP